MQWNMFQDKVVEPKGKTLKENKIITKMYYNNEKETCFIRMYFICNMSHRDHYIQ